MGAKEEHIVFCLEANWPIGKEGRKGHFKQKQQKYGGMLFI